MNVRVQWFKGDGSRAGSEQTTIEEIDARCADAHCSFHAGAHGVQLSNPNLVRVLRLATGEVARVFKMEGSV